MTTAKILAFAGSARRDSWNRKVLAVAVAGAQEAGAEVTVVNLGDYPMPIYDADWHAEHGVPAAMLELRRLMMAANGLLIASPEYNASITPLLKNTIDWLSQDANGESGRATSPIAAIGGSTRSNSGRFGGVGFAMPPGDKGTIIADAGRVPAIADLYLAQLKARATKPAKAASTAKAAKEPVKTGGPMRLPEAGRGTAGRGQLIPVGIKEGPQHRFGRLGQLVDKRLRNDGNGLDGCALLEPAVVVPPQARRRGLEPNPAKQQGLHPAGHENRPQGLKHVFLRDSHAAADTIDDCVKILRRDEVVGPFSQKLVDRGVADHDPVGLSLSCQQERVDHIFFVVCQAHSRGILAGGGHGRDQKLVHDLPHDHGPLDAALAEAASRPRHHHRIGAARATPAHLEDRREHEEREHRHDCQGGQGRFLVLAKNSEGSGHGTACRLLSRRQNRRGLTRKDRGG